MSVRGGVGRVRGGVGRATSTALLLVMMVLGSLGMWIGLPVLWLYVAGRVQGATDSLGAAVGVALLGLVVSILVAIPILHWLGRKHNEAREARGLQNLGWAPLEGIMAVSATLAIVAFCIWFFFLAGAEPLPLTQPE